jgi:hypothetical protein
MLVGVTILAVRANHPLVDSELVPPTATQLQRDRELDDAYRVAQERRERIERELSELGPHEWAGLYDSSNYSMCGNSLEFESFAIASRSGFVWVRNFWSGHSVRVAMGEVMSVDANRIRVHVERDVGADRHARELCCMVGFPDDLIRVQWGSRRYLVPSTQVMEICSDYSSGCERVGELVPLLGGGEDESELERPEGIPTLPPEYRRYLSTQPIRARVTAVGDAYVVETWRHQGDERLFYEGTALVDAGSAEGVAPGMALRVNGYWPPCLVTEVFDHAARIKYQFSGGLEDRWLDHDDVPAVGSELWTQTCR